MAQHQHYTGVTRTGRTIRVTARNLSGAVTKLSAKSKSIQTIKDSAGRTLAESER